ncbi:hypothetical protein GQ457_03G011170 [Hibiscus cannabinus]
MLDFFEQLGRQINPIPAVLAETFISLNACRKLEGIRFRGCAHLLQVWALSHFWKIPTLVLPNMSSPNFSPLREFLAKEWPEIKRSKWVDIFKDRRDEEIVWRVPWLGRTKILYKCGDYNYLMLLGVWGGIDYHDVFAWSYQDMPGLDTDIVMHRLPIKTECKPVQQKLRRMKPEMLLKIRDEVRKQLDAGFLQVAKYPEWVANIVPVPKKDGKVRMCVDYRDLNRASPKDNFPLPHIDTLVDNTAGHSFFSFMDGFSGYNQIKMCPEDMEKTTFVTMWGTFCYKVMPFGLKNAGATYQRAMVTLFHDMMHKEIEVYVDDMITKSRTEDEHIVNLEKLFQRLRKFRLRLNPSKRGNVLLGHIGKVIRLLRKNNPGTWDKECQEAFEKIKKQLSNPPILKKRVKILRVLGDSALVIYQIRGEWETRDTKLVEYHKLILKLAKEFDEITFKYIPREENQMADALATLAAMFKANRDSEMMPIELRTFDSPAHCYDVEEEVDGLPWYHDVLQYIKHQEYPSQATENDKKTIRKMAAGYLLDGEVLYKRSRDLVLLRCVNAKEAQMILEEVHEGVCGTHPSGFTMARRIMRFGYFWSTMEKDCIDYARKCHKCQIYADKIHAPPQPLHVMTAPWPFSMWGMDVIGQIHPKASNGHRFILVAIDYFTKWVEAASYASITRATVCKFLKKEIICRYGMPERIITDNATNLNNKMMDGVCEQFNIKHHNSVAYRPKMNGAVEAANKNIKKIVEKMTETYKDWHEKLPFALYAYRTSVRTSTGATPFSLVYGMEAVLPIEVEIPSLRVLMEAELDEAEWVQARYDQLNLIEEKRLRAICHGQMYQKRMIRAHDKKVRPREFREGDLVLRKALPNLKDTRGKWAPNWEGPYIVTKAFSGGALILAEMDGDEFKNPVNSDSVKKYYA